MSRLSRGAAGRGRNRTIGLAGCPRHHFIPLYGLHPNFPPRFDPARQIEMPSAKGLTELENRCWMIGPVQPDDAGLSATAIVYTE